MTRIRHLSLRARLTVGIVAVMTVGFAIAGMAGLALMRSYLMGRVDEQLLSTPPVAAGEVWEFDSTQLCALAASSPDGRVAQLPTTYSLSVLDAEGRLLCRLPDPADGPSAPDLSRVTPQLADLAEAGEPVTVGAAEPGPPWRIRILQTSSGFVTVGISLDDAFASVARLQLINLIVSCVLLVAAGAGGWAVVRLGLRPLTRMEEAAHAIAGGDLSTRVDAAPASTEVGRLATSLNAMLTQIELGFAERLRVEDRLRQVLADASHELRTPLASIRGHAELYRQGIATEPDQVAVLLSRIESESIRMGDLVEDLLLLARLDARPDLRRDPVDLFSVASDVLFDARSRDPSRRISLNQSEGGRWLDVPAVVTGDEPRIRQVLTNLVANVLRYTPAGSPFEVTVAVREDAVEAMVIDHGPGLAPGTADRVFERFYREDYGRARRDGGAGLGLSIVAGLMAAHGGRADVQDTPGGGCTFVLVFPGRRTGCAG